MVDTCRVDFTFPSISTISAELTIEKTEEMSPLYAEWTDPIPPNKWDWPIQTWYDYSGATRTIYAFEDTRYTNESTGICGTPAFPPEQWDYVNNAQLWTDDVVCHNDIFAGSFGLKFFTYEFIGIIGNSITDEIYTTPEITFLGENVFYTAPGNYWNYHNQLITGSRARWKSLASDAALIAIEHTNKRLEYWQTYRIGGTYAPNPFSYVTGPGDPESPVTITNETIAPASSFAVVNNECIPLQATYAAAIDDAMTTYLGWTDPVGLWNSNIMAEIGKWNWVRLSYGGEKIVFDLVANATTVPHSTIRTTADTGESRVSSIWVGGI